MVGRGEMEHANARGVVGERKILCCEEFADGESVGLRITFQGIIIGEKGFCVVDKGQTAHFR